MTKCETCNGKGKWKECGWTHHCLDCDGTGVNPFTKKPDYRFFTLTNAKMRRVKAIPCSLVPFRLWQSDGNYWDTVCETESENYWIVRGKGFLYHIGSRLHGYSHATLFHAEDYGKLPDEVKILIQRNPQKCDKCSGTGRLDVPQKNRISKEWSIGECYCVSCKGLGRVP